MSRTETANHLTVSGVTGRIESWGDRMARLQTMQGDLDTKAEALRLAQAGSVEEMARQLVPVAEAMASLIEQTRQTLDRVVTQSRQGHAEAVTAVQASTKAAAQAASDLSAAMLKVGHQVEQLQEAAREARAAPPPSPWGPAIIAALVPTAAIVALAWRLGALRL